MLPARYPFWGNLLAKAGRGLRSLMPCRKPRLLNMACLGSTMGTMYDITVLGVPAGISGQDMDAAARAEPDRIEALMSTYRADSDVGRINAAEHGDWVAVSAETVRLIQQAIQIGRLSGGAYDITAGPLVNLWGFGPHRSPSDAEGDVNRSPPLTKGGPGGVPRIPTAAQIDEARRHVGLDLIEIRDQPPAVRKKDPLVRIDLASIAKGYGVDCTAAALDRLGIKNYCIGIGGEIRTRGRNNRGVPWQIGIEAPKPGVHEPYCIIPLANQSLATSGDYRIFTEADGRRLSHVIDPRTGRPINNCVTSVSVVHASCATADAWATALMVAGPEAGFDLAVREGLPALFLVRDGETIREESTPQMRQYLRR
jgi:FAD:protein FMN transferase